MIKRSLVCGPFLHDRGHLFGVSLCVGGMMAFLARRVMMDCVCSGVNTLLCVRAFFFEHRSGLVNGLVGQGTTPSWLRGAVLGRRAINACFFLDANTSSFSCCSAMLKKDLACADCRAFVDGCVISCHVCFVVCFVFCAKTQESKPMSNDYLLQRIITDAKTLSGKPIVRGTRLSVEFVLGLLASGASYQEILEEYNGLTQEDILACLLFATKSLETTTFMPLSLSEA
jgi:uncharacterized protein (DUF433 family)